MIYTAWGEDGCATCLIPGPGPPATANGRPYDAELKEITRAYDLIWTIEAESWEDAMRQYHELQGWKPYRPMGEEE